jgi:hypothetical protein
MMVNLAIHRKRGLANGSRVWAQFPPSAGTNGEAAMTSKRMLLFAPCAFNLAETSRMLEIAKAGSTR